MTDLNKTNGEDKGNPISRFLKAFGSHKDGIVAFAATIAFILGAFQYLEYRSDLRISAALDILKRREARIFVEARDTLVRKWLETEELQSVFASTVIYTDELIEGVSKEIGRDENYRRAVLHISAYYQNVAGCTMDGICDAAMMCSSLAGEIQDHLDINKGYFALARALRDEDAVSLYLGLPEFVNFCVQNAPSFYFSRLDRSRMCQAGLFLNRKTGLSWLAELSCHPQETEYGQSIIDAAKPIKLRLKTTNGS